ncbi:YwmB family TATA-box binding protein [Paenibacillus oenotherae]|uniref:YwmB family TATA-box binding protein n=1 Tax=Paenibacillus oenotherae TaxID=1435645 RepID=A0ABS7D9A1_9BACL|nr:YwmB family TATA-box binding protein [Paenibacillus oenotherae]MBW7476522.1 YwmB family TATA-box binding protein [Paenibacillus oenotherae]
MTAVKPGRSGTGRSEKKSMAAALLVIVVAVSWTIWQWSSAPAKTPADELLHDLQQIWTWSDGELVGGAQAGRWSFRWDGRWTYSEVKKVAAELDIPLEQEGQEHLYRGKRSGEAPDGYVFSIWANLQANDVNKSSIKDAVADVVLLLDVRKGTVIEQLIGRVSEVEAAVSLNDLEFKGSFSLRGQPVRAGALERLAGLAGAERREEYEDGQTTSIAYYSDELFSGVNSGEHIVNLQIAERSSAADDKRELIVGVPLITGDYSMGD